MKECRETDCTRASYCRKMCQQHYAQWYYLEHRDKIRTAEKVYADTRKVLNEPKGHVGYFHAHKRIKMQRGPAREQMCPCGSQALQWSLRPGMGTHSENVRGYDCPYSLDVNDYDALCRPCHWARDWKGGSK